MSKLNPTHKYMIIENLIVFLATAACVSALAFTDKDVNPLWGFVCLVGLVSPSSKKEKSK